MTDKSSANIDYVTGFDDGRASALTKDHVDRAALLEAAKAVTEYDDAWNFYFGLGGAELLTALRAAVSAAEGGPA